MNSNPMNMDQDLPDGDRTPRVNWRSAILFEIADRNPFFLISAACMLWGCLALTNSQSWVSLPMRRLIVLLATLNVYEAALIGLALLLLGRGLLRDGKILLIVEAFFLVDVTFLNTEIVTANLRLGIWVNVILFVLAIVKLRLVMRALGTALPAAKFVYVMIQMIALLAIPCVLRGIDHGSVSPFVFYMTWWIVGLMPAVREVTAVIWGRGGESRASGPAALYLGLPWISLIAHVGILHYVYGAAYYGAMFAPVLLGLAVIVNRAFPTAYLRRADLLALRVMLPLAAILVSVNSPHALAISLGHLSSSSISTAMLATTGAILTYLYCFLLPLAGWFLAGGALVASAVLFGPSVGQMERTTWRVWTWMADFAKWIVPNTTAGWGLVSVLSSFFFLVLGAAVSLAKPRVVEIGVETVKGGEGGT